MEEIGNHPAIFVLVGVFRRDTADADNLSALREVRRAVLFDSISYGYRTGEKLKNFYTSKPQNPNIWTLVDRQEGFDTRGSTYQKQRHLGHSRLEHSELVGATFPRGLDDHHRC